MTRVRYARRAFLDLDRLVDFLRDTAPNSVEANVRRIAAAVEILADHPLIGRPVEAGLRELVISRGRTGYLALYRYDEAEDCVTVLALRHQREAGYAG